MAATKGRFHFEGKPLQLHQGFVYCSPILIAGSSSCRFPIGLLVQRHQTEIRFKPTFNHSIMITSQPWEKDTRAWIGRTRSIDPKDEDAVIRFFEHAFDNISIPQKAWFGIHKPNVSLVIGGVFLAAIVRSGNDKGLWVLLERDAPEIEGIEYRPAKFTGMTPAPLIWAHSPHIGDVKKLIDCESVWSWYKRASTLIFDFPRFGADRDTTQLKRGKQRLSDFRNFSTESLPIRIYPDEIDYARTYKEGAVKKVTVNAYERNSKARQECIDRYGTVCCICGFDFEKTYGSNARGIIHVHHIRPLSEIGQEYNVSAIDDLRPVCPNCHTVIHSKFPAYSIEQVREMLYSTSPDLAAEE